MNNLSRYSIHYVWMCILTIVGSVITSVIIMRIYGKKTAIKIYLISSIIPNYLVALIESHHNRFFMFIMIGVLIFVLFITGYIFIRVNEPREKSVKNPLFWERYRRSLLKCVYRALLLVSTLGLISISIYMPRGTFQKEQSEEIQPVTDYAYSYEQEPISSIEELYRILDDHKEGLWVLRDDNLIKASDRDIEGGIQELSNCLSEYLRTEKSLVRFESFEDEGRSGVYYSESGIIALSDMFLEDKYREDPRELYISLGHELRHVWQNEVLMYAVDNDIDLNLPIYNEIRYLKINMENGYISVSSGCDEEEYMAYAIRT